MINIRLVFLGHLPHSINKKKIEKWKSNLFNLTHSITSYRLTSDSDCQDWSYSDINIQQQLPQRDQEDILIAITNVKLQNNYFARRYTNNRICVSLYEMTDILKSENIPIENLIFRVLYSASIVYKRYGNRIPQMRETTNFAHDETRGCIFDMNGIKTDVIYSTNKPILCNDCTNNLLNNNVSRFDTNLINSIHSELSRIKKDKYYRITDFIKKHPVYAIIISSISAIILGIIGSIIATIIYENIIKTTKHIL